MTTRRALALLMTANPNGDLAGLATDVSLMRRMFEQRGNIEQRCVPTHEATRARVLEELERLREDADDRHVVVYYAGHGSRAVFSHGLRERGDERGQIWPFLVTADHHAERGVFHGIFDFELSASLAAIDLRARSTTAILDCCFAGGVVRGATEPSKDPASRLRLRYLRPREYPRPSHLLAGTRHTSFESYLREVERSGLLHPQSHPRLIRVLASSVVGPAYEIRLDEESWVGAFTHELCDLLTAPRKRKACWRHLVELCRRRLLGRTFPLPQEPSVEGPSMRVPFATQMLDESSPSFYFHDTDEVGWITSGHLHATRLHDRFEVLSDQGADEVRVIEVFDLHARVRSDGVAPQSGAPARLLRRRHPCEVSVTGNATLATRLKVSCKGRARMRTADPLADPSLHVDIEAHERVSVHRRGWATLSTTISEAADELDRLARSLEFDDISRLAPKLPKRLAWRVDIHRIRGSETLELSGGEQIQVGDRLWFGLHNLSTCAFPRLFFHVFERDAAGRLSRLNADRAVLGVEVAAGTTATMFHNQGSFIVGHEPKWPRGIADVGPLRLEYLFLICTRPVDLRGVDQDQAAVLEPLVVRAPEPTNAMEGWCCKVSSYTLAR